MDKNATLPLKEEVAVTIDKIKQDAEEKGIRAMGRVDRRRIMDALDIAYPEVEKGYATGDSDNSVAKRLNVPRAWVSQVREEVYGPEFLIDVPALLAESALIKEKVSALGAEFIRRLADLEKRAAALDTEIEAIKRRVGR